MKYSITRALAELKLLKDRINKEIFAASMIAVKHGKKLRSPYTSFKEEDFVITAKSQYQSIIALMNRLDMIKIAIDRSNFETKVKIGSKEMTVLEALVEKGNITFKKSLLNYMKQQQSGARREVELATKENKTKVENIVHDQLTSKDISKKEDVEKEAVEGIEKLYEIKLIDPLALEDKIKELETEIEEFEKNVDFVLSESNSTTFIEIPD
jgi:tetrahydromethanopterin S-methyltransferase subunit G